MNKNQKGINPKGPSSGGGGPNETLIDVGCEWFIMEEKGREKENHKLPSCNFKKVFQQSSNYNGQVWQVIDLTKCGEKSLTSRALFLIYVWKCSSIQIPPASAPKDSPFVRKSFCYDRLTYTSHGSAMRALINRHIDRHTRMGLILWPQPLTWEVKKSLTSRALFLIYAWIINAMRGLKQELPGKMGL